MTDCPPGGSGAAVAAPAAAGAPTAAVAAPSVATATALHLARAVLGLSASEKAAGGAGRTSPTAAPAAPAAASVSAVPVRRALPAAGLLTEEEETPQPAAALFRAEKFFTAPSSGVATPDASESPGGTAPEATAVTLALPAVTTAGTAAARPAAQPAAAGAAPGRPAAECYPATAAATVAASASAAHPASVLPLGGAAEAAVGVTAAAVPAAAAAPAASGPSSGHLRQVGVGGTFLGASLLGRTEPTGPIDEASAAGNVSAAQKTPQTALRTPALAAAPHSLAAILGSPSAALKAEEKLVAVSSSSATAAAAARTKGPGGAAAVALLPAGDNPAARAAAAEAALSTAASRPVAATATTSLSAELSLAPAASSAADSVAAGGGAAAAIPTAAAGTSTATAASVTASTLAATAGTFAGRGLKRAPAGGILLEETVFGDKSKNASESGDGVALLARLLQKKSCLIITDVQNDFCEGGALGGSGRRAVITRINQLRCLSVPANKKKQQMQKQRQQQQQQHAEEERQEPQSSAGPAAGETTWALTADAAAASEGVKGTRNCAAAEAGGAAEVTGAEEAKTWCPAEETVAAAEVTGGNEARGRTEATAATDEMTGGRERAVSAVENRQEDMDSLFDLVVVSQDWHPPDHASFALSHSSNCNPYACCCGDSAPLSPASLSAGASAAFAAAETSSPETGEAAGAAAAAGGGATEGDRGGGTAAAGTGRAEGAEGSEEAARLTQKIVHGAAEKERQQQTTSEEKEGEGEGQTLQKAQHGISLERGEEQKEETQDQPLALKAGKRIRRASTNVVLDLWPVHCVQHSFGAALHPALLTKRTDVYIKKGTRRGVENYSCFGSHLENTGLREVLERERIEVIVIVGFTTEYCVRATAFSALQVPGIEAVYVLTDCCCSIDPEQQDAVFRGMQQRGVRLCSLRQLLRSAT